MGTSLGGAIDYLVAALPTLLTAVDSTALVVDNYPTKTSQAMVIIGRSDPDSAMAGDGTQMIVQLGAGRREESYSIPCFISVYRPGPTQKPARDAAIALFDVVAHLVAADPSLGSLLQLGRMAYIERMQLVQTRDSEDAGGAGSMRLALLSFDIHVSNSYIP